MDVKSGSDGSCSFDLEKSGLDEGNDNESKKLNWKKIMMDFGGADGLREGNGESGNSMLNNIVMVSDNDVVLENNHGVKNLKQVKSETSSVDVSDNTRFSSSPFGTSDVVESSENSVFSKECSIKDGEKMMNVDSVVSNEVYSHKRKRDCFDGMLRWMANVAKDPADSVIGGIPECSKWALYGNDNSWKQALLARETLFVKKIRNQSADQFSSQKMHPSMFDHSNNLSKITSCQTESNPPRLRQRLEVRLDMQPTASIYTSRPQQRIPIGKYFQAELPEWTGVALKSDCKWLGTITWPLEKTKNGGVFESVPLGKGRAGDCGCQFPDSVECVKFHVSEKRMKTRSELGSAFYAWNFDKMGEACSDSWTIEEEKKIRNVVMENPKSSLGCFWEPLCKALPKKRLADLVNYYWNVFMLRRRGYQNRHYPTDIDSDDDETEYPSTNSFKHGPSS